MKLISFISNLAIPFTIFLIIIFGLTEKKQVFDIFIKGAKEGLEIVIKIIPTLIGLFLSIGILRASGIFEKINEILYPILNLIKFPTEILPLALIRPISGSASIAVGTDLMKTYGVDSKIGLIVSTIMGSTETTIYTIAVYTGVIGIKKTRFVLWAALLGDLIGIIASVVIWRILS